MKIVFLINTNHVIDDTNAIFLCITTLLSKYRNIYHSLQFGFKLFDDRYHEFSLKKLALESSQFFQFKFSTIGACITELFDNITSLRKNIDSKRKSSANNVPSPPLLLAIGEALSDFKWNDRKKEKLLMIIFDSIGFRNESSIESAVYQNNFISLLNQASEQFIDIEYCVLDSEDFNCNPSSNSYKALYSIIHSSNNAVIIPFPLLLFGCYFLPIQDLWKSSFFPSSFNSLSNANSDSSSSLSSWKSILFAEFPSVYLPLSSLSFINFNNNDNLKIYSNYYISIIGVMKAEEIPPIWYNSTPFLSFSSNERYSVSINETSYESSPICFISLIYHLNSSKSILICDMFEKSKRECNFVLLFSPFTYSSCICRIVSLPRENINNANDYAKMECLNSILLLDNDNELIESKELKTKKIGNSIFMYLLSSLSELHNLSVNDTLSSLLNHVNNYHYECIKNDSINNTTYSIPFSIMDSLKEEDSKLAKKLFTDPSLDSSRQITITTSMTIDSSSISKNESSELTTLCNDYNHYILYEKAEDFLNITIPSILSFHSESEVVNYLETHLMLPPLSLSEKFRLQQTESCAIISEYKLQLLIRFYIFSIKNDIDPLPVSMMNDLITLFGFYSLQLNSLTIKEIVAFLEFIKKKFGKVFPKTISHICDYLELKSSYTKKSKKEAEKKKTLKMLDRMSSPLAFKRNIHSIPKKNKIVSHSSNNTVTNTNSSHFVTNKHYICTSGPHSILPDVLIHRESSTSQLSSFRFSSSEIIQASPIVRRKRRVLDSVLESPQFRSTSSNLHVQPISFNLSSNNNNIPPKF